MPSGAPTSINRTAALGIRHSLIHDDLPHDGRCHDRTGSLRSRTVVMKDKELVLAGVQLPLAGLAPSEPFPVHCVR